MTPGKWAVPVTFLSSALFLVAAWVDWVAALLAVASSCAAFAAGFLGAWSKDQVPGTWKIKPERPWGPPPPPRSS